MLELLLLAVAAPSAQASNMSFAEIEGRKHAAYRQLTDYRDTMRISVQDGDDRPQILTIEQRIARERLYVKVTAGDTVVVEGGYDGARRWVVSHLERSYAATAGPHDWHAAPYRPLDYGRSNEPQFDMKFDNGYGVRFDCNPPLRVTSNSTVTLAGRPARLVVARAEVAPNRFMEIKQWFETDRYILRRFEVEGRRANGRSLKIVGEVTNANQRAGLGTNDFRMVRPSGYTEIKPPPTP